MHKLLRKCGGSALAMGQPGPWLTERCQTEKLPPKSVLERLGWETVSGHNSGPVGLALYRSQGLGPMQQTALEGAQPRLYYALPLPLQPTSFKGTLYLRCAGTTSPKQSLITAQALGNLNCTPPMHTPYTKGRIESDQWEHCPFIPPTCAVSHKA